MLLKNRPIVTDISSYTKASSKNMPALDGMRALSILMVIGSHAGLQHLIPGGLGVLIFFVISGFLITRLMIEEIAATGTLNIPLFYVRRVLRLMPTLLASLVIFVPILLALGVEITLPQTFSALFYLANYYHIYFNYPAHSPFPIFWSLAVEEHFYIIFPFLVWTFRKRLGVLVPGVCAAVLAVLAWRYHLNAVCLHGERPYGLCGAHEDIGNRIFHGTDSIVDCILFGVLTAMVIYRYTEKVFRFLINNFSFFLSCGVLLFTLGYRNEDFRQTIRFTLQAASIAVIIINVLFGDRKGLRTFFENSALVIIGRWSYALYIFHFGTMSVIEALRGRSELSGGWDIFFYICGSFALSGLTYVLLEKPMQKVRRRFHGHKKLLPLPPLEAELVRR